MTIICDIRVLYSMKKERSVRSTPDRYEQYNSKPKYRQRIVSSKTRHFIVIFRGVGRLSRLIYSSSREYSWLCAQAISDTATRLTGLDQTMAPMQPRLYVFLRTHGNWCWFADLQGDGRWEYVGEVMIRSRSVSS
jgi:hypothetical protein